MNYWLGVLTVTFIYMIAIAGVALFTGFTGLFSFGHAGFMAVGAYVSGITARLLHLPVWLSIPVGVMAAALVAVAVGLPTLRLKGDYFVIATLGFGEVVRLIVENLEVTGGARGLPDIPAGTSLPVALVLLVGTILFMRNFIASRHGRNCVAVREDEMAAETAGINVTYYKVLSLAISAACCGLAGGLLTHWVRFLHPSMFGMVKSTELTIAVIFGGLGSLSGSMLAGAILTPLPEFLRVAAEWRLVAYGLIVVLMIIFRPEGLLGYREFTLTWPRRKGRAHS